MDKVGFQNFHVSVLGGVLKDFMKEEYKHTSRKEHKSESFSVLKIASRK